MRRPRVLVEGAGALARRTAVLLAAVGEVVTEGDADLVVSCAVGLPDEHWCDLDLRLAEAGVPWHRAHTESGRVRVGPFTRAGGVTYRDARTRLLAATGELPPADDEGEIHPEVVEVAAAMLAAEVVTHLTGGAVPEHELTIEAGQAVTVTARPVLPLPGGPPTPSREHEGRERLLVGDRFGPVRRVRRDRRRAPDPRNLVSYSAYLAHHPRLTPWVADPVTGGATLGDDEAARWAAIGEAAERYCGNHVPEDLPRAAYRDLGDSAVDPRTFALYSKSQYDAHGFPFTPMTADLEIAWTSAVDLEDGRDVLVPASLAYVNYFRGSHRDEPPTNYPLLAGTAAADSPERAREAALREVLERDAVTLWWQSGAPASPLPVPGEGPLADALHEAAEAGLTVSLLRVPSAFDAMVAAVFVEDTRRHVVGFGSACRTTAEEAASKAFTEAIGTYQTGLDLLDEESGFWRGVRSGTVERRPYLPYRADRAYLDGLRPGWRDLNDVRVNVQVYLDERMQDAALDRLRVPVGPPLPAETVGPWRSLAGRGLRPYAVDLTTRDVRAAGLSVARVMVPGLYGNAPAAFPFLGGTRLLTEPVARGWVPGPLTEDDLWRRPLPFA
ncbi:YcaO-like family protein [Streptosporangium saharense]|uniref:Thiazole/oxazole-forming peptide maturase SagD family component n=1 Tax=Streptosporangium saharense TaxID=1706840 RepID=A0A7W7QIC8_9ACTN|nr:YcaO-like family protein [Streptosporangium saharense]MBB4913646.1 thiazole/oxazole-forming peptide maturase SagD family component [Streptosporangium saharense]